VRAELQVALDKMKAESQKMLRQYGADDRTYQYVIASFFAISKRCECARGRPDSSCASSSLALQGT
jgi:hypothetical protein